VKKKHYIFPRGNEVILFRATLTAQAQLTKPRIAGSEKSEMS